MNVISEEGIVLLAGILRIYGNTIMFYSTCISKIQACVFIICSFAIFAQSDVPRPRGVSLSKASLYSPTKDFTCFDGTITIPFSYVNDDYCDCFDGSDEPGTSACLNGVFHCSNAGHRPENIPSSRVNDGVCDCCDGTDEYSGRITCPNTCDELGREAQAKAERLAELYKQGYEHRLHLIEKGNRKRSEMGEQLAQLEKDKADAETVRAEKEALKSELEAKENEALKVYREAEEQERQKKVEEERQQTLKEATEYFKKLDSNGDGQLVIAEITVVNVFDKDKNGEVDEEEIKYFLNENENVDLETFITATWPLVKPLLMMEQGMFRPEGDKEDLEPYEPEDDEDPANSAPEVDDMEDDLGEADGAQDDVEDVEPESNNYKVYDDNTQKLVDEASAARQQLTEAERNIREIDSNIRVIKENLEKDYGQMQEYASLDGDCFEFEDKEYVYKLCMFQKVTQKSKNGGSEVGLGNWGEWAGPENDKYSVMKYTNGIACWNGPNRSTTVDVQCGLETKLLSVTEPYRCEYKMELSSPAACDVTKTQETVHDEL